MRPIAELRVVSNAEACFGVPIIVIKAYSGGGNFIGYNAQIGYLPNDSSVEQKRPEQQAATLWKEKYHKSVFKNRQLIVFTYLETLATVKHMEPWLAIPQ